MKKLQLFLGCVAMGVLLYSCEKDSSPLQQKQADPQEFTPAAARQFFEATEKQITLVDLCPDSEGATLQTRSSLSLNDFYPAWEEAISYSYRYADVVEMPLRGNRTFFAHRTEYTYDDNGVSIENQVYMKLVTEQHLDGVTRVAVIATMMPDAEYLNRIGADSVLRVKHRPDPESGFTGTILYSYPNGQFIRGHVYRDGKLIQMIRRLSQMPDGYVPTRYVDIVMSDTPGTRGGDDDHPICVGCGRHHAWNDDCGDPLVVIGDGGNANEQEEEPDTGDNGAGGGGGGFIGGWGGDGPWEPAPDPGGGGGNPNPNTIDQQKRQEDKANLEQKAPCDNKAIQNATTSKNVLNTFNRIGMDSRFTKLYANNQYEWISSMGYNTVTSQYDMTNPRTDYSKDQVRPELQYSDNWYTIATVHNHPSGGGPSIGDALALGKTNEMTGGYHQVDFIVTADGTVYALYVEDAAKANRFYNNQNENKKALEDFWEIALTRMEEEFHFPDEMRKDLTMYATAYVLDAYDAGIKVMRLENGSFKQKTADDDYDSGQDNIKRTTC